MSSAVNSDGPGSASGATSPVITPADVRSLIDPVLVDCRPDVDEVEAGRIAGAHHAQLERDLSGPVVDPARGGRHPLPSLRAFTMTLGRWGVTPDRPVVAYDAQGGANAAARLWWMLSAIGHRDVHVVDGGLDGLVHAGFPLSSAPPAPVDQGAYEMDRDRDPERDLDPDLVAENAWTGRPSVPIEDVAVAAVDPDRLVIDVRAAFRYRGESEPIDPVAGHVPGAVNVPLDDALDESGRFRSPAWLRDHYGSILDGRAPADVIVHCGSGVTACHTLLALEHAGLLGAGLYVGSWSEWCRSGRPRA